MGLGSPGQAWLLPRKSGIGQWEAPAPPLCCGPASSLTSGATITARTVPGALGGGLGWPSSQLYSRPQQKEPSPRGIAMVPLGHSVTSSPTLDLSGLVPQAWGPQASLSGIAGHSSQAQIVCTLRQSQYSPRAKGVHTRTHACAHGMQTCVLTCTPASPRDRSPLPMLQQACKAHALLLDPLDPRPRQPCPWGPPHPGPRSQEPKALAQAASVAEKVSGLSQPFPWSPDAKILLLPPPLVPTLDLHSLPQYSLALLVLF